MPPIDYVLLGKAIDFYRDEGFTYVEVPWVCDLSAHQATTNAEPTIRHTSDGYAVPLVGSAEQSLIVLGQQGRLAIDTPYMACTPCFRDEETIDLFHRSWFMKVELFVWGGDTALVVDRLLNSAVKLFRQLGAGCRAVETYEGFDVNVNDIEVGSYGLRNHDDFGCWAYGTGIALPRFSAARAMSGFQTRL